MRSVRLVSIFAATGIALLLGACSDRSEDTHLESRYRGLAAKPPIASKSQPKTSTNHLFPEQRDWRGVRRLLLDFYLTGQSPSSSGVTLSDFNGVNRPITSLTVDGHKLDFNEAGRRLNRQLYSSNYSVREHDGTSYLAPFADVLSADSFERLRKVCQHGGSVMRVSLSKSPDDRAQTAAQWFPGKSPETSYVVESIGRLSSPPTGLTQWRREYAGSHVYRVFKIDPNTGMEGRQLAWIVDVLSKRVEFSGKRPSHYVLKRFHAEDGVDQLPNFLVAHPDGMVSDPSGREFHYFGEVVDDDGNPKSTGVFLSFRAGPLIADVNAPEPNAWGQTTHKKP